MDDLYPKAISGRALLRGLAVAGVLLSLAAPASAVQPAATPTTAARTALSDLGLGLRSMTARHDGARRLQVTAIVDMPTDTVECDDRSCTLVGTEMEIARLHLVVTRCVRGMYAVAVLGILNDSCLTDPVLAQDAWGTEGA